MNNSPDSESRRKEQSIAIFNILQEQLVAMVAAQSKETNPRINALLDIQIKDVRAACHRIVRGFVQLKIIHNEEN